MMAGLSITKAKETIDGIFPLKTFCLSLALLILLLIGTVGVYQLLIAEPVTHTELTGKTIGIVEVAQKIEDQPIQTVPDPEPVASDPHNDAHIDPNAQIEIPTDTPAPATEHAEEAQTSITIEDSIAGLSEETPSGYLPIIRDSDGLKSFDAYKAPFKLKSTTKGVISLVMVDYGLSDKLAKNAIETLPAATTFVASPYSTNLQAKVSGARSRGMEVWMELPMQGTQNSAPVNMGPNAILPGINAKENLTRLNTHLGRATGYAGIAINVKPAYPDDAPELKGLLRNISIRGLGIAQLTLNDTLIEMAAAQLNAPYIHGDIWADDTLTKNAVLNALQTAEKSSLSNGQAVVAFHPSALVNSVIADWQKSLAAKNIQLAPLTFATHISRDAPQKTPESKAETTSNGPKH